MWQPSGVNIPISRSLAFAYLYWHTITSSLKQAFPSQFPGAMSTLEPALERAIGSGIAFLQQHQYPNGEFCCYLANTDSMQDWCVPDTNVFPTALVAGALLFLTKQPGTENILSGAVKFLRGHAGRGYLWQHYTERHPLYPLLSPDVDDTSYASAVLTALGVQGISSVNTPVLLANRNSQGLFYTWFVFRLRRNSSKTYWRVSLGKLRHPLRHMVFWKKMACHPYDIDSVVNANALYYLGDRQETQPVISHLIKVITEHKEAGCDKWYRRALSVYYFISRNYYKGIIKLEPIRQLLIDRVLATGKPGGAFGESALDTALAVCTLFNLHYTPDAPLQQAISWLLSTQQSDGSWVRWRLYYGHPDRSAGYGSEELTTAFCLEALARYRERKKAG